MPDEADAAQEEIDRLQQASLEQARKGAIKLEATGRCHNCDEPLKLPGQLFCDTFCADDYERRVRAERMRAR